MVEMRHGSHVCELGTSPNRQGYLILGDCPLPPIPLPEECPGGPADPAFGYLPCRCLQSRLVQPPPEPDKVALRPRDLVRLHVEVGCGV